MGKLYSAELHRWVLPLPYVYCYCAVTVAVAVAVFCCSVTATVTVTVTVLAADSVLPVPSFTVLQVPCRPQELKHHV
eukprot:1190996-Prorocentrum_minimum.AAC.2